ncbi:MAG: hypothetical protein HYY25_05095 [Candidatus Wallbacteria bacterium]|nr:hypothetical protein [Candidatus Wallbacteria bacterium]
MSAAPDESRRKATPELTGPKEAALACLLSGGAATHAAAAAGVTRQTVSEWLNHDPVFASELQNRRAELWAEQRHRLEAARVSALDTLTALLFAPDWRARLAAATRLLDFWGPLPPAPGETTPEAVAEKWTDAEVRREQSRELQDMIKDM